jgi:type IV pilus assembly protein PilW
MKMHLPNRPQGYRPRRGGFSLIELMVAMGLGLFLTGAVVSVYLVQTRMTKSSTSQAGLQNAENAIAALVTPMVRSAGFFGCALVSQAPASLVAGGPPPLSLIGTATGGFVAGFEASRTGPGATYAISATNSANSATASAWAPALDSSLSGATQAGSDVLVLLGAAPNVNPISVTTIATSSSTMTLQDTTGIAAGQFGVVSDCLKSSIFKITAVSGNTVTHAAGAAATDNISAALIGSYIPETSQFMPLQQSALYVAHGQGDQSVLTLATYGAGTWSAQPLVPGVESMQVLYGVVDAFGKVNYLPAAAGIDWSSVHAVRLGFLLQGAVGSGGPVSGAAQAFSVLGTTIRAPADGRLRHVFEVTINLRSAAS